MRAICIALAVAASLVFAACDTGETSPSKVGEFDAQIRGAVSRDLDGDAGYLLNPGGPGTGLFISLVERESGRSIAINDPERALETVGTYALTNFDGPFISLTYSDRLGDIAGGLRAVGGSIQVTRVADGRVEATVTAQLAAGADREPSSTLTATFEAARIAPSR